ncbi:MAG: CopG family transcriptional regulator [Methylococcaceae bacterium]
MKAIEFDELFDNGETDILEHLVLEKAQRPELSQKQITLELPLWMIELLDKEAQRMGESRQSLIKFWLSDKLAVR